MTRVTLDTTPGAWDTYEGDPRPVPLDKARMIAVIEAEGGLLEGVLCDPVRKVCGHAGRCAMGALMFALGIPNSELLNFGRAWSPEVKMKLLNAYGITSWDQDHLIDSNDNDDGTPAERAARVIETIKDLDEKRVGAY